jgi:2-C-methyl-D-erythritol 2,4-cyclodiphosphate synthase
MWAPRIGLGYDLHRLVKGRPLILGGVTIPHTQGLSGHSDADVVCHALADAILGSLGLGDIGVHFPPSDPKWQDSNSLDLLRRVWRKATRQGARLVNADVTVVAEAPRLTPHVQAMRSRLADCLGADAARISIKATTNEGVGPEGAHDAISALAVCLLQLPDA